jgi:alkyl hydroperoxide reductase subunit AhpC
MTELVQLERRHEEFSKKNARIIAVSVEGLDDAKVTQMGYPHLTVVSDEAHGLTDAAGVIHQNAAPDGSDIDVPTTILVDKSGTVRWLYRSPSVISRLSPDEVLQAIDEHVQ